MRPVVENWNIVVTGLWNTAIFSPQWVGERLKELFGISHINLEFVTDARGTQVKFSTERFTLVPQAAGLIVAMKQIDNECLEWGERLVSNILQTLPHTPVNAFGVNFAFIEEELSSDLGSLFRLSDDIRLADHNYETVSLSIRRSLRLEYGRLNAMLTMTDGQPLSVRLNFHHDVPNAETARTRLTNSTLSYKAYGLTFLENVYGLTMEEE